MLLRLIFIVMGCTTIPALAYGGYALKYYGDDEVVIPNSASLSFSSSSQFTIEAWFMKEGAGSIYHIVSKRGSCPDERHNLNYQLAHDEVSRLQFSSAGDVIATTIDPQPNEWVHMATTYDGSTLSLYVNGILVVSAPFSVGGVSNASVKIGAAGDCSYDFVGEIDEVRIWNVARTAEQIAAYYDKLISPYTEGLVGYWNFDEDSTGQSVLDISDHGNNGTLGENSLVSYDDPVRVTSTAPLVESYLDASVERILSPGISVFANQRVIPSALIKNIGNTPEMVPVRFQIGQDYIEDTTVMISPGDSTIIEFPAWRPEESGTYLSKCFTHLPNDINHANDTVSISVAVISDVLAPVIYSVSPDHGGTGGRVTMTINGDRFQHGAIVTFVRSGDPDIVVDTFSTFVVDSVTLQVTIESLGASSGIYDVLVTNPDGRTARVHSGFRFESDEGYLWANIIGRQQIRRGRPCQYIVAYGNSGNIDGRNVSLLIAVPARAKVVLAVDSLSVPYDYDPDQHPEVTDSESVTIEVPLGDIMVDHSGEVNFTITVEIPEVSTIKLGAALKDHILLLGDQHSSMVHANVARDNLSKDKSVGSDKVETVIWDQMGITIEAKDCDLPVLRRHPYYHMDGFWYAFNGESSGFRTVWKGDENTFYNFKLANGLFGGSYIDEMSGRLVMWTKTVWKPTCGIPVGDLTKFKAEMDRLEGQKISGDCITAIDVILFLIGSEPLELDLECLQKYVDEYAQIALNCPGYVNDLPVWEDYYPCNGNPKLIPGRCGLPGSDVEVVSSWDPNDKVGPIGYGVSHYVRPEGIFNYMIYFENIPSATAPSDTIWIVDTLSSELDWNSFAFGEVYPGAGPDSLRRNYVCAKNFNPTTGVITWGLYDINLPPNNDLGWGEGWVSYSVRPKPNLVSGDTIQNIAAIKFDVNPWILAPMDSLPVINTIDACTPVSHVLSDTSSNNGPVRFLVRWEGTDGQKGSGIASYSIYFSTDSIHYQPWILDTIGTQDTFNGAIGKTYYFYSIAKDHVGHIEPPKTACEARWIMVCCTHAGDANNDTEVNVGDAVFLVNFVFKGGATPPCKDQADANHDCQLNVGDAVFLINYVFKGGTAPQCGCVVP